MSEVGRNTLVLNLFSAETASAQKNSVRAAEKVVRCVTLSLRNYGGCEDPTISDLLRSYQIVVCSNDSVYLGHRSLSECNIYGGVGFRTLRQIQELLQSSLGEKLPIIDERSERCRRSRTKLDL